MTTATDLHNRAVERGDKPETIADIIARSRFAAEWHQEQARKDRAAAQGFYAMSKDEGYKLQQREDALYSAAEMMGKAHVHEDAARFADSIADALITIAG